MRITNNMIMNNAKVNINGNKVAVDAGDTQMTTQKKISRPSDDPVIAAQYQSASVIIRHAFR